MSRHLESSQDRAALDEALFATPPEPLPDWGEGFVSYVFEHAEAEPNPLVGPGCFMVVEPAPAFLEEPGLCAAEVPAAALEEGGAIPEALEDIRTEPAPDEVAFPPPSLAANTGARLATGGTVVLGSEHLRFVGGQGPFLVDVMLLSPPLHGALLREGVALTGGDVFTQEDIYQGRIRYRHDGGEDRADSFLFATPLGEIQPTAFDLVIEVPHRAPEVLGNGRWPDCARSCRVAELLEGSTRSREGGGLGLALVGATGRGTWERLREDEWLALGEVHYAAALLLGPADVLRFQPRSGWSGKASLAYHVWDRTMGEAGEVVDLTPRRSTGGSTAFSRGSALVEVAVRAGEEKNDPVAEPWLSWLTAADLIGGGLAVVRVAGEGKWQVSPDDGRSWGAMGEVYHGKARLLRSGDRVRFVPRAGWTGKVVLSGRAWNGEGGEWSNLASRRACGEGTPFGEKVRTWGWWVTEMAENRGASPSPARLEDQNRGKEVPEQSPLS